MAENQDKAPSEEKKGPDVFVAVMRIKTADATRSPSEEANVRYIEPGKRVTGLSKEEMKRLWDAGAIRRATVEEAESLDEPPSKKAASGPAEGDGGAPSEPTKGSGPAKGGTADQPK